MPQQPEVVFDVAQGDLGAARHLRRSLEVLASSTADPELRRNLGEVLAGRASMREFGKSEGFARLLDGIAQGIFHRAGAMSAAERERLAALGLAELDSLRESGTSHEQSDPPAAAGPDTHTPHRDPIVDPGEPDADDRYFEEHRRRGWLE
ncbi:hypothetical protein ACWIGW_12950 [Nocardia brasiliensis]